MGLKNLGNSTPIISETKPKVRREYKPRRCLNCEIKDEIIEKLNQRSSDIEDAIYTAMAAYKNKKNPKSVRQLKRWREIVEGLKK